MITRLHGRLVLALLAGGAAIATTAVLATSGSAQTQPAALHLLDTTQRHVGFAPRHEPGPGDRLGFGGKITGDDTGISRGVCTIIGGSGGQPCTIWVKLARGTLTAQGLLPERAHDTPIAITGGTGAYNGARGTAQVTDVSPSKTRITITLTP